MYDTGFDRRDLVMNLTMEELIALPIRPARVPANVAPQALGNETTHGAMSVASWSSPLVAVGAGRAVFSGTALVPQRVR